MSLILPFSGHPFHVFHMFSPFYGRIIEIGRLQFWFHFQQVDIAAEHANAIETTEFTMKRKILFPY